MISADEFRNGVFIEYQGEVFQIIEFRHITPSNGEEFFRIKLRDIQYGDVIEKTFSPNDEVSKANIDRKNMQYLFKDDECCHFMDIESYAQIDIPRELLNDSLRFVKENEMVKVCSYKGNIFDVEPPLFVELRVTSTESVEEGNADEMKEATVETGAVVSVPLFVNVDDVVKIDTRTGEYLSRV